MRYIRHYNRTMTFVVVVSFLMIPLAFWYENRMPRSKVYKAIFQEMLASPILILNLILTLALTMLPFIIVRKWKTIIKEPKFFAC